MAIDDVVNQSKSVLGKIGDIIERSVVYKAVRGAVKTAATVAGGYFTYDSALAQGFSKAASYAYGFVGASVGYVISKVVFGFPSHIVEAYENVKEALSIFTGAKRKPSYVPNLSPAPAH